MSLPDDTEGYLRKQDLTPLAAGTTHTLDSIAILLSEIGNAAVPVEVLDQAANVEVLARYGDYHYVKTEKGNAGWIMDVTL